MIEQKIIKTGNSLAITIPAKFVKITGLKPGDRVQININAQKGNLQCTFLDIRQLHLV